MNDITANETASHQKIDKIIAADWIVPMDKEGWLIDHAVLISGDTIRAIVPFTQAQQEHPQAEFIRLPGHVIMPGLVNSHCHAAMNLLRGLSDDLPLKQWLEDAIWPVEAKHVDDKFVYQGTQHAIAEMIRSGTTCFQDMYFMPDQTAEAVHESGIRASVGLVVVEFETAWAKDAQECIDKGLDVFDQFKHSENVTFNFAPHAPYTVSKQSLEKIGMLSFELNLPVQIHLHETAGEVENYIKEHGIRPMASLKELGLISPLLNAVHMTQLNEGEIDWLAEGGASVIHCPQSNMKLASGICPTMQLIDSGVNLAIGTDGAASNNDLDMLSEMQSAALLAKLDYLNPSALTAYQALYAGTMGGAKALGLQDEIGSLEAGKKADIIAIDLNQIETQPVYNPISQLVYSATRNQVTHSWVNGKALLKDRKLLTVNSELILQNVAKWKKLIKPSNE